MYSEVCSFLEKQMICCMMIIIGAVSGGITSSGKFLAIFVIADILGNIFIRTSKIFKIIVNYVNTAVSTILQYFNTAKIINDKDIILAYIVAREWLEIVYPECYNKEDDVFEDVYIKVINKE